ncbi:phosphatidylserine decarboxylase proenzyme 1, mitochondrial [Selaginella moellendorffii]|uniref:phosphatidylserine decarboxylase proenzyme 1, mitochondrial n=1 Tax=Selaginella moellendorffii TaxID=88036 RepID=UPI000D1CB944|nr:phosphatidylserine decarboxylase proenzyme 1, mitochondrial [Selaginella moellendorffii]|eukprot:XP_024526209.1 phosphatidylserine decarboxylase proenzyme 1, mitochondrial [Selaginella moellendorffii]
MALLSKILRWRARSRARFSSSASGATAAAAAEEESVVRERQPAGSAAGKARSFLPGATVATLAMVAVLQGKRIYEEKQMELAIQKGIEPEFSPDTKASFLRLLPLRFISRVWGSISSINLPTWSRPYVYKGWARAFHTDLDEVPLSLEEYSSLREFFARGLKAGARPIDTRENCMLSPVDGIVTRYGRVAQPGAKVEQVKGFTYSLSALLGFEPNPIKTAAAPEEKKSSRSIFTFWRSPGTDKRPKEVRPPRALFYCVLYLGPGDYHRVHSPSNWCIENRRHFSGDLYPVNARAARTIKNLYVVNERIVLEGEWQEGLMSMALVGATNCGSIELKFEPDLKTNTTKAESSIKENCGYCIRKGDEVATFNLGSTVVMVFEAPGEVEDLFKVLDNPYQGFNFTVEKGQRIKMGQALGQW